MNRILYAVARHIEIIVWITIFLLPAFIGPLDYADTQRMRRAQQTMQTGR